MNDLISRQAAINALEMDIDIIPFAKAREYAKAVLDTVRDRLEDLPSAQQEQSEEECDTCKHGYFGDSQCNNCRVRYPSHYEREGDQDG